MGNDEWVEERLAVLSEPDGWEPDVAAGWSRLRERRHPARWLWAAAATAAAGLCIALFPAPRALAQRCVSCSVALWQTIATAGPGRAHLVPEKDRKPAPDFTLTDDLGKPLRLSGLRGKVVVLNFWATWCHGCQTEIPWFIEFQKTLADRGFAVLGVSRDDDGWTAVRPYIERKGINYRMAIGTNAVAALYGADKGLPLTVIIDRQGRMAARHEGVVSKNDCRAEIDALL